MCLLVVCPSGGDFGGLRPPSRCDVSRWQNRDGDVFSVEDTGEVGVVFEGVSGPAGLWSINTIAGSARQ